MSNLTILITDKCNLACDFCTNKEIMADKTRPSKELDVLLEQFLLTTKTAYKTFHISGGEPLINLPMLEEVLSVILSYNQEAIINIYTNGCYLTEDLADILNCYPNIKVNISIDRISCGERGFFKLLEEDYKRGYLNVKAILKLRNKTLRSVLKREDFRSFTLAAELLMLSRFFQATLLIDNDWSIENLNNFDLDDVYNVGELIFRLEELYNDKDKVYFNKMFERPCQGECSDTFKWDGEVIEGCHLQSVSGCQMLRHKFKPGVYDLLSQLVNFKTFEFDTQLEDKPRYDKAVGFIGERKELIPTRKQLQYEDRVNLRFKKNEILFKDVS